MYLYTSPHLFSPKFAMTEKAKTVWREQYLKHLDLLKEHKELYMDANTRCDCGMLMSWEVRDASHKLIYNVNTNCRTDGQDTPYWYWYYVSDPRKKGNR